MRRLIAVLVLLGVVAVVSGCGGGSATNSPPPSDQKGKGKDVKPGTPDPS